MKESFGVDDDGYRATRELPAAVESALRRVDLAFASARLSDDFDACPHCYTEADRAYLRTVPPSEMTNADVGQISFSLRSTIGSPDDVAHFVPAMLRAQFRGVALEDALVLKNLAALPAADWTSERREALRAAYDAFFDWHPDDSFELEDPAYRAWIVQMLDRPPNSEPVERPIPGWDP